MFVPAVLQEIEIDQVVFEFFAEDIRFRACVRGRIADFFGVRDEDDRETALDTGCEGELAGLDCATHGRGDQELDLYAVL